MADLSREEVIFNFQAETAAAQAKVDRFSEAIDKARASSGKVGQGLKNGLLQAQKQLSATTRQLKQYEQASRKAAGGSTFLYQQIGYLASDARYGLLGVANNLSIVTVGLQNMAIAAKKDGQTFFQAFKTGLLGGGGILLGIQVLIAILPEVVEWISQWGAEGKKLSKVMQELNAETESLADKIEKENKWLRASTDQRKSAAQALTRHYQGISSLKGEVEDYLLVFDDLITAEEWENLTLKEKLALLRDWESGIGSITKQSKELAAAITEEATNDKVLSILGMTTRTQDLQNQADIEIKKIAAREGSSYADASEKFWASNKGRLLSAKIIVAQRKAQEEVRKTSISSGFTDEVATYGFDDLQRLQYAREKVISNLTKIRDELLKQDNLTAEERQKINNNYHVAVFEANKHFNNQKWDYEERAQRTITDLVSSEADRRKTAELKADASILSSKARFFSSLSSLYTSFGGKSKAIQTAFLAIQGGFQIAELIAKGKAGDAAMTAQTIASNQAAIAQGAALAIPTAGASVVAASGVVSANLTALGLNLSKSQVAQGWGVASIAAATGASVGRLYNGGGSAGGGAGGGSSAPSFNIIGQGDNNALQTSIQEQTGVLKNGKTDSRVVLVTTDLEVKQNDQKVALETATL